MNFLSKLLGNAEVILLTKAVAAAASVPCVSALTYAFCTTLSTLNFPCNSTANPEKLLSVRNG